MKRYLITAACVTLVLLAGSQASPDSTAVTDTAFPLARMALPDTVVVGDTVQSGKSRNGIKDTIYYTAEHLRYDIQEKTLHLWEKAQTRYQDITLNADTIIYRMNDNLFEAHGNPELIEQGDTTVGEFLTYNVKTRRGSIRYATTRMGDEYFTGHQIVKNDENILYIRDGDYTSCAYLDDPHYSVYGHNLKIIPKQKAISRPVVLNIGSAPVVIFPYYVMPLERGRQSGWLQPGWGGNPSRGGYMDNIGYYWAPNDYMDFRASAKVEEFEDFVMSGSANYRLKYWIPLGRINARYVVGTNYASKSQEWSVDFNHNQNITPDGNFTLNGGGTLTSSKRNEKTFYQTYSDIEREILRQRANANLALSKRFTRINASANLSVSRDHDLITEKIDDMLPSFSFSLPDRPLIPVKEEDTSVPGNDEDKEKWFNKLYYGFSSKSVVQRTSYGNDSLNDVYRPGTMQKLNFKYNHKLFKYISFSPFVRTRHSTFWGYTDTTVDGYTYRWDTLRTEVQFPEQDSAEFVNRYRGNIEDYRAYDRRTGRPLVDTIVRFNSNDDSVVTYRYKRVPLVPDSLPQYDTTLHDVQTDFVWNAGLSMSTNLYGTFPIKIFNFAGIRHTLTPSVTYTFVPRHDQQYRFFSVPGIESSRASDQRQLVTISLNNLFQGKVLGKPEKEGEKAKPRTFSMFNAGGSASYDFEAKRRKWSDLRFSASTKLPIAGISFSSSWWLYDTFDNFSYPLLRSYDIRITPNNFSASGSFWGGDLLVFESLNPVDPIEYAGAGMQQWSLSLNPSYSYSASRYSPNDVFIPRKNFALSASGRLNFTRHWSMQWSSRYNFNRNRFDGHSLNFRCDLECWNLVFDWRPSGLAPGYYFKINVKKIPEIKWEVRD